MLQEFWLWDPLPSDAAEDIISCYDWVQQPDSSSRFVFKGDANSPFWFSGGAVVYAPEGGWRNLSWTVRESNSGWSIEDVTGAVLRTERTAKKAKSEAEDWIYDHSVSYAATHPF